MAAKFHKMGRLMVAQLTVLAGRWHDSNAATVTTA